MDKWLWAARFFKTRVLAARACELGRVLSNSQPAKPAREVHVGNMLRITNDGGDFEVEVLLLAGVRGPASFAQTLYRATPPTRDPPPQAPPAPHPHRHSHPLPPPPPPPPHPPHT